MTAVANDIQLSQIAPDPIIPLEAQFPNEPGEWVRYARHIAGKTRQIRPRVVFIGDSITQGWGIDGLDEWNTRFSDLPSSNLGIGGDRTQNVLWRIGDGALDGITPELVVLLVGVNNLWSEVDHWSPKRVSEGVCAVVAAVRAACASAHVLALGVLPTQADPDHPLRGIVRAVNAHSAATLPTADGNVQFVDIGHLFLEPDGTISPDIMHDACHLTARGYTIFANAIAPLINRMLAGNAHNAK